MFCQKIPSKYVVHQHIQRGRQGYLVLGSRYPQVVKAKEEENY